LQCPTRYRPDIDYHGYFTGALTRLHAERRYRVFADLERIAGRFPHAMWHSPQGPKTVVIWCSNDYLGMGQHPKVVGAMVETATRMGTGAGGTRNIAGNNHPLVELEHALADLHRKDAALVFTSGYISNETGISTLARLMPNCLILSDALNHNSMIEGVRQAHCEKQIFRHNDMAHLEQLLAVADPPRPKLIVFESLYSMDGDVAPLAQICDLAARYGAMTWSDYARHRLSVFTREEAKAIVSYMNCKREQDTTGLDKARIDAALQEFWLDRRLYCRAQAHWSTRCAPRRDLFLRPRCRRRSAPQRLRRSGTWLQIGSANAIRSVRHAQGGADRRRVAGDDEPPTHIVPVFVGDPSAASRPDLLLGEHGIIQPINYPTVPKAKNGCASRRAPIDDGLIDTLAEALVDIWQRLGLPFKQRALAAE
jgi:5-aminolevulinate synthase